MRWLRRACIAVLIVGLPLLVVRHEQAWWWIEIHTGTVHESGPYYGFFSGFGSDLGEYTILVLVANGLAMHWRHLNCHEPGCPWIGRFPAAGGDFRYCQKHHPDFGGKHPTREHILARHREHRERMSGPQ